MEEGGSERRVSVEDGEERRGGKKVKAKKAKKGKKRKKEKRIEG